MNSKCESVILSVQKEIEPETHIKVGKVYDEYFASKVFKLASFLRINFSSSGHQTKINSVVTAIMFCLGVYTIFFNIKTTFTTHQLHEELATQLLIILWGIQSLISLIFIIYWQLNGHFSTFRQKLTECQGLMGLLSKNGKQSMKRTNRYFHLQVVITCSVTFALALKFYLEDKHSEFSEKQSYVFYYPELRPVYTLITTYLHIVWNMALFVLMLYTNAAYLEMGYYNKEIQKFDGSTDDAVKQLLRYLEVYSNICEAIRQLDMIFRLFTFIMIVITVPSMVITLMMMNHRIHSFLDFLFCMPAIGLCAFSFFSVTIAPARLHDEVTRTKGCLCQNKSIWFPYRKEVYLIANTLSSHMEQFDLGVSVWGFAVLSRPLILGTLSATAMMLSLLTELAPKSEIIAPIIK